MKLFATGKWNKEQKRWSTVVAIRRPGRETAAGRRKADESASSKSQRPR